jgi:hypothetical protein
LTTVEVVVVMIVLAIVPRTAVVVEIAVVVGVGMSRQEHALEMAHDGKEAR